MSRMAVTAAVVASPVWLTRWASPGLYLGLALAAFFLLARLMSWHFKRFFRLRYLSGRPDQALFEFQLWRPFLPRESYQVLQANCLIQAGLVMQAEAMAGRVSPWLAHEIRVGLARLREDWPAALAEMESAYADCPDDNKRSMNLSERVRFLAEFYPDRLEEAFELHERSLPHFSQQPVMQRIGQGIQAELLIAAGAPEAGEERLREALPALERRCQAQPSLLPWLAEFRRWLGRARWAQGDRQGASEHLSQARLTAHVPNLHKRIDADIDRLKAGEPLFGAPSPEAYARARECTSTPS